MAHQSTAHPLLLFIGVPWPTQLRSVRARHATFSARGHAVPGRPCPASFPTAPSWRPSKVSTSEQHFSTKCSREGRTTTDSSTRCGGCPPSNSCSAFIEGTTRWSTGRSGSAVASSGGKRGWQRNSKRPSPRFTAHERSRHLQGRTGQPSFVTWGVPAATLPGAT